jgi:hypothetical protein
LTGTSGSGDSHDSIHALAHGKNRMQLEASLVECCSPFASPTQERRTRSGSGFVIIIIIIIVFITIILIIILVFILTTGWISLPFSVALSQH